MGCGASTKPEVQPEPEPVKVEEEPGCTIIRLADGELLDLTDVGEIIHCSYGFDGPFARNYHSDRYKELLLMRMEGKPKLRIEGGMHTLLGDPSPGNPKIFVLKYRNKDVAEVLHVLAVGEEVVAKFAGYRGKSGAENPWFSGTVTRINESEQCQVTFCDGDKSWLRADEVMFAPGRDTDYGKDEKRGLCPSNAEKVTLEGAASGSL